MKRTILAVLCLLSMILVAPAATGDPAKPPAAPGKLVVHEWGTFTGFAGSDGVHLPFRSSAGGDLPGFVFTRFEQAVRHNPNGNAVWLDLGNKDGILAMQRMETPVVYFYTDAPREVEARVEFPQGLLTEFYPPVRSMTPPYAGDTGKLERSSLDWGRIRIDPAAGSARFPQADRGVPKEAKNHYFQARATDAATVQFSDRAGEVHEENFLFYRGLGNFTLPVTVAAAGDDRFYLRNAGPDPIASAFLIRISNGKARFSRYRNISPQRQQEMTLPAEGSKQEDLCGALVKALVAEGLYEKEARAMVKTWESSWFGEEGTGTRVLYTLPRRTTDALLPLRISPTPDETVRVLVGRIDVLTPEQEDKIAGLIKGLEAGVKISREDARELKPMGRFLTPALERAADRMAKTQAYKLRSAVYSTAE